MAKIKINKLPEGFELVDGKVVKTNRNPRSTEELKKFIPTKAHGGGTGDQYNYSLQTIPTHTTNMQMSDANDPDVRYSLSSVPRDIANLEAEGGETVLTDLNQDGNFGLYDIKGPRHGSGGVPMYLPEQSFIYSDTRDLKMNRQELAEFGLETRKKMTPAAVSKKFPLNQFYGAIEDEYADDIQVKSAELMLQKNRMDLSKLAFGQELKKGFDDGVPLAAHPYLVSEDVDPIEFTQKVEGITRKQAEMKALGMLPPELQEKVLQLRDMMMQAEAMPQDPQQMPQDPMMMQDPGMMPPSPEGQVDMAQAQVSDIPEFESKMAKYGKEILKEYQGGGGPNPGDVLIGGTEEWNKWYMSSDADTYRKQRYDAYKTRAEEANKYRQNPNNYKDKKPRKPFPIMSESDYHDNYMEGQEQIKAVQDYYKANDPDFLTRSDFDSSYEFDPKYKSKEAAEKAKAPMTYRGDQFRYKQALEAVNKEREAAGLSPFTQLKPAQIAAFESGYIGGRILDNFANDPDALNEYLTTGVTDDDVMIGGVKYSDLSKESGWAGNTFFGELENYTVPEPPEPDPEPEPCENAAELEKECTDAGNIWIPYDAANPSETCRCQKKLEPEEPGDPKEKPDAEFWKQDLIKMNAIAQRQRRLGLPWQPEVENVDIDYVLEDPTRAIAAINEQANTLQGANMAFSGPQAGSARNMSAAGKTMKAVADATAGVQARNVQTANRADYQQAVMDFRTNAARRAANVQEYNDTERALQNFIDEKNFDREQYADAYINALTNRANTYNLNLTQPYFNIDPYETAGMITQVDSRAFDPRKPSADRSEEYYEILDKLERKGITGADAVKAANQIMGMQDPQDPMMTNIQYEYNKNNPLIYGYPGTGSSNKRGGEKKLKKYATPFYTGKMGM